MKRGFVLPLALVALAITTILTGGMLAYYSNTAGIAARYIKDRDLPWLAGQYAMDKLTSDIRELLPTTEKDASAASAADVSKKVNIDDIVNTLNEAAEAVQDSNGYKVKLDIDQNLKNDLEQLGEAEVTITAHVRRPGGLEVATYQQVLEFKTTGTTMTTLPIFDFVYFANDYGRLNSKFIIANGNVGANAKLTLKGATINGFAQSAQDVELDGADEPLIWPRATYMAKVAAKYDEQFTQARPTDPIVGMTNGVYYTQRWPGGYDPVVVRNPHSFNETAPARVDNPGRAPEVVPEPSMPRFTPYSDPKLDPEPKKTDWKYRKPTKGSGDYAYPDEPEARRRSGSYNTTATYKWYYKNVGYGNYERESTSYSSNYQKNKRTVYQLWENDKAEIDEKWEKACAQIDRQYEQDLAAVRARNEQKKREAEAKWFADSNEWVKVTWPKYQADLQKRNDYLERYAQWDVANKSYQQYLIAQKEYDDQFAKYMAESAAWEMENANGTIVQPLKKDLFAESSSTNFIVKEYQEKVVFPDIAKISDIKEWCQNYTYEATNELGSVTNRLKGGTLDCENAAGGKSISFTVAGTNMTLYIASERTILRNEGDLISEIKGDVISLTRKVNPVHVTSNGQLSEGFQPFTDTGSRFSSSVLTAMHTAERGSVVLIGTSDHPISLNGPVYINGDVIIRGLVRGAGTIYAKRNIHIIGDITYEHPPYWPHERADLNLNDFSPENVKRRNASRDVLSLVARGNIIVGDYASGIWTNANQLAYLDQSGKSHLSVFTTDDGTVGSVNHNYLAVDNGTVADVGYTHTQSAAKNDYVPGLGLIESLVRWRHYVHTYTYEGKMRPRKYYESAIGSHAISGLKQTSVYEASAPWQYPTSLFKSLLAKFGFINVPHNAAEVNPATATNKDAGDITNIDALLFANHGIFGVVGGSSTHSFTLNGAMICRDEGLLTSFADRFASYPDAQAWINWDMRLKSNSAEGLHTGLIEEQRDSAETLEMTVKSWRQIRAE